jgi:hypothetical protein
LETEDDLDRALILFEHFNVRATLSLDHDVARALRREMKRSGFGSLKAAVNHFLRLGLGISGAQSRKRFVVHPRPMGLPAGLSYDSVGKLLIALEDDNSK